VAFHYTGSITTRLVPETYCMHNKAGWEVVVVVAVAVVVVH